METLYLREIGGILPLLIATARCYMAEPGDTER